MALDQFLSRPAGEFSATDRRSEQNCEAVGKVPARAWTPVYDGDGKVRDGARVAEIAGLLPLAGWPEGLRVIVRKERPHPRRAAAVHRHRRAPVHLFRHLGPDRAARRP